MAAWRSPPWSAQAASADEGVSINAFTFSPADVSVPVGSSVTWTNLQTGVQHTTSSLDGLWDSGVLSTSDTFSFTFSQVGDFTYQCNIHPSMRGVIHVVPDADAQAVPAASADQPPSAPPTASSSPAPLAPVAEVATATPLPPTAAVPAARPTATAGPAYGS